MSLLAFADTRYLRKRRTKLWKDDPHCRKCGVLTVLPARLKGAAPPHNEATIQHLDSKWSEERGSYTHQNVERTTLWCWLCNWTDGREREKEALGK